MTFNWKHGDYHPTPFITFLNIFLLILILAGVALLCTQNMWLPKVTDYLLRQQYAHQTDMPTTSTTTPVHYSGTEQVRVRLGQSATILGVKILPTKIIEDSRCPVDVVCIQAGTVKVEATLESSLGKATYIFTLAKPAKSSTEEITLMSVLPVKKSGGEINSKDYVFNFQVKK